MVEFRRFLGTHPHHRLPLVMHLIGQFPGAVGGHAGNVLHQATGDVFKGVDIIVQNNHLVVRVVLANDLTPFLREHLRGHGNRTIGHNSSSPKMTRINKPTPELARDSGSSIRLDFRKAVSPVRLLSISMDKSPRQTWQWNCN